MLKVARLEDAPQARKAHPGEPLFCEAACAVLLPGCSEWRPIPARRASELSKLALELFEHGEG